MRCPTCSTENPAQNRYCENCGARLVVVCAKCGHSNPPAARFCGSCGSSLDPQATPSRPETARVLPVGGERKQATVLFADIVGSTQLIAGLDPEQAMEQLHPAVLTMCEAVERFEGTIVRTLGDGIMALFGAPRAQEGHALLACEAALAIREAFAGNDGRMTIRVGLHSGIVVSDAADADPAKERGVHGATIHLASRLQQMAAPGGICLTEDCYRLVRGYCDVHPLGQHPIRGFAESVEIYELLGLRPAVASQQFLGANLTSFRGRDREIAVLRRALQSAENGDTKAIGISAPPGSGKSRLCYEFAEWCRSRSIPVLEARALIYGHATPLQPVLEFLRLFFGISAADDPSTARTQIAQRVLPVGRTFEADLPLLYEFLGVADEENAPSRLDPKTRHARLLDIIRHVVRQSGTATSVIIIEDLHWLDAASEDFIEMLVDAVAGTRTMLVLNFRPSYAASWMKWAHYEPLSLSELGLAEMISLVEELIGDRAELNDIRHRVSDRSGGNPFFAEELVRSLAERGALFGDMGDYRLGIQSGESALPPTVEAVIGARIDRLGEAEKAVLQVGAIIGKEFPFPVLEQVLGMPSSDIEGVLTRLCGAELVQERANEGRWFAFRHPLIQEVAYATQLKTRRSTLHASVASAMEAFYKDRLDEFAGLLAYHYDAAGRSLEAANYGAKAALWIGTTDAVEAAKHWHKVRLLLQAQPRSQAIDELRIMASAQIALFGWRGGMTAADAKAFIDEALAWARETQNSMVHLLLAADGRITVASGGSADVYVDRLKEALSLLQEQSGVGRAATLNAFLSQAYNLAGMLNEALIANTVALQGVSRIERSDEEFLGFNVEHWARSLRGRILVRLGRFAEAEECLEMMLQIEQTLLDPAIQFIPHFGYVDLAWCRGDADLAMKHALRVTEIAERSQIPYLSVYASAFRGTAKALAQQFDAAVTHFSQGLASARKARAALEYEPEILASLADCYCQMGNFEQAETVAMEAIEVARQRTARLAECRASITCGAAILGKGDSGRNIQAVHLLARAEELIRLTGAKIYEPLWMRERARAPMPVG